MLEGVRMTLLDSLTQRPDPALCVAYMWRKSHGGTHVAMSSRRCNCFPLSAVGDHVDDQMLRFLGLWTAVLMAGDCLHRSTHSDPSGNQLMSLWLPLLFVFLLCLRCLVAQTIERKNEMV